MARKGKQKQEMRITWHHERRPVTELLEYGENPRIIKKRSKKFKDLQESLDKFGLAEPISIQPEGTVIGGHARLLSLQEAGAEEVDCWVPDRELTPAEVQELNIRLNKNTAGEWDLDRLKMIDLNSLMDWGFTETEIGIEPERKGKNDPDSVPETPKKPRAEAGDVFQLGDHRLMCGDSTDPGNVKQLMGGDIADMVWTDPPYNVDYSGKNRMLNEMCPGKGGRIEKDIKNDHMKGSEFYAFLLQAFGLANRFTKPGGAIYVAHADTNGLAFRTAFQDAGFQLRQCLIWVKNIAVIGRQDYNWQHEPILYGWKDGAAHYFVPDFTQTTVRKMEERKWDAMDREELLAEIKAIIGRLKSTVTDCKKPHKSENHPTMKPVELVKKYIQKSSKKGEIVLDLFGGSGTTLIAAEQTYRRARLMEYDPRYADVIIQRWEEFTGEKAVKV